MIAIYILWLRQLKRFIRKKTSIVGALGQPIIFLLAIGFGFGPVYAKAGGGNAEKGRAIFEGKGLCATCHQVPKEHSVNPRAFLVGKPKGNESCEKCHSSEGPTASTIPQVASEHTGRYLCWDCHYPHLPEGK